MPKVTANGINLHYVEVGSGEPLLLIMGFGGEGHVYFWERPDLFNAMCLEFLARQASV